MSRLYDLYIYIHTYIYIYIYIYAIKCKINFICLSHILVPIHYRFLIGGHIQIYYSDFNLYPLFLLSLLACVYSYIVIFVHIYIYVCVCVCVYVCKSEYVYV